MMARVSTRFQGIQRKITVPETFIAAQGPVPPLLTDLAVLASFDVSC